MSYRYKVGRNEPCPCGRRLKYKQCCEGKIDWEAINRKRDPNAAIHCMSARGRDLLFLERISEALQFDRGPAVDLPAFKRSFTPSAVRRIYEAVMEVWPPETDLELVLTPRGEHVSALYTGFYEPQSLERAVGRHCLYADKIQLFDPLPHPAFMRPEFNPLEYPEHYLETTLRLVRTWLAFAPWIYEGLVEFVRPPTDFDPQLHREIIRAERSRVEASPELKEMVKEFVREARESKAAVEMKEVDLLLSAPDEYVRRVFKEVYPDKTEADEEKFLQFIHRRRETHPTFIPMMPDKHGKLEAMRVMTTGGSYLEARLTAAISGSYLATDIPVRWRMIELDREYERVDPEQWAPLAKAFGSRSIKFLSNVGLADALRVRQEDRLGSFRAWLRRVWHASAANQPYSEASAVQLAAELDGQLDEAQGEWDKIDQDLLKYMTVDAVAGFGPTLATGSVAWAASAALAGVGLLLNSTLQRRSFYKRFPGAFMLDLRRRQS